MYIDQVIRKIISEYSQDILTNPARFQSLVRDFANNDQELLLFNFCCQRGMLVFAQKIISMSDTKEIEMLALQTKSQLQEESFMAESKAIAAVNMFLSGLNVTIRLNSNLTNNNEESIEFFNGNNTIVSSNHHLGQLSCTLDTEADKKMFLELVSAADNMEVEAMILVGDFYKKGNIVKRNRRVAKYYYKKAAELGNTEAQKKYVDLLNEYMDR